MGTERSGRERPYKDFPAVPTGAWKEKIREDLNGADYHDNLVWHTLDGFDVNPFYRMEDLEKLDYLVESEPGRFPFLRSAKAADNRWLIRQEVKVRDPHEANRKALKAIYGGATSLGFDITGSDVQGMDSLRILLQDISLDEIVVNFILDDHYSEFLEELIRAISGSGTDPMQVRGSVTVDPLGKLAARGNFRKDLATDMNELKACTGLACRELPLFRVIHVGGDLFHDAGGSITQELALTLSLGNEYLARLTGMGMKIADILPRIQFQYCAATSFFMVIAKHRAARYLWSKIAEAYDPGTAEAAAMFIHTSSSSWTQSLYDPYVNILRTTTSSMAAIIGGTDSLEVSSFDTAYKQPDTRSERIARNTQIILKEEAWLDKVIDPSSGSYYIENLTDSLISKAWELFLDIEEKGGFYESLTQGFIQDSVDKVRRQRRERFATRKVILLGTNQYPDFEEEISGKIDPAVDTEPVHPENKKTVDPLFRSRSGEEFEKLRLKTEHHHGKKPVVFMLTLGNLAMRRARATFACNFYACAGFRVLDNTGFASSKEGAEKALNARADIVVLCCADDEYPVYAKDVARRLKGKCMLVIAGDPVDHTGMLEEAGYEHYIHEHSNVLKELANFQKLLGI